MDNDEKRYFTIGEVAQRLGVNTSTIRFWETEFESELRIQRSDNGRRVYTRANLDKLSVINHLIRNKGLRIEAAREALHTHAEQAERQTRTVERLERLKAEIQELADGLGRLQKHQDAE